MDYEEYASVAEDRRQDALVLLQGQRLNMALYTLGIYAEMLFKAAYIRDKRQKPSKKHIDEGIGNWVTHQLGLVPDKSDDRFKGIKTLAQYCRSELRYETEPNNASGNEYLSQKFSEGMSICEWLREKILRL